MNTSSVAHPRAARPRPLLVSSVGAVSCAHNRPPTQTSTGTTVAADPAASAPTPLPAASARPGPFDPRAPLTPAQTQWIDSTLASLPLRERVGQMVMVWVLGDYTNYGDSTFAEVRRWIERDHIGGVSMSLGTPIEVAAKINDMQRLSRVPLHDVRGPRARARPARGRRVHALPARCRQRDGVPERDGDRRDGARPGCVRRREDHRAGSARRRHPDQLRAGRWTSTTIRRTRSSTRARSARIRSASRACPREFVRGTQDGGAISTAKHFPGHGDTDVDSHVGLPVVGANWTRLDTLELVPFRAAIDAGAGDGDDGAHRAAGGRRRLDDAGDARAAHHHRRAARLAASSAASRSPTR